MSLQRDLNALDKEAAGHVENKMIPAMREAVELVRMMLFADLKSDIMERGDDLPEREQKMLAGAVVNNLFGTPNSEGEAGEFAARHRERIEDELRGLAGRVSDLLPLLTDALRMRTICDNMEGMNSLPTLLMAKTLGLLQEDRPLPMPSTFMLAVRTLGTQRGLLASMTPEQPPQ